MVSKYKMLCRLLLTAAPLLLITTITFSQSEQFKLTVRYRTQNAPTKLYLHINEHVDSSASVNGIFVFGGSLNEPARAIIREPMSQFFEQKEFYIDSDNFEMIVADSIQHATIKNSRINEMAAAYQEFIKEKKSRYDSLSMILRSYKDEGKKDSMRPMVRRAFVALQQQQINYVQQYPSSWMSLVALNEILFNYCTLNLDSIEAATRFKPLRAMFNKLERKIRKTPSGEQVDRKITALLNSQVGNPVIEFAQAGHNGAVVNTADYRGKYFLIDFWGSWCVWCRKGHPHLKELYDRYRSKGFEIIAVSKEFGSAEEQKKNWLAAIEKDDIQWKHIMVTPENDLAEQYGIVAYPTKFLIDPAGKIVLRVGDDFDRKLDKKLEEIYR